MLPLRNARSPAVATDGSSGSASTRSQVPLKSGRVASAPEPTARNRVSQSVVITRASYAPRPLPRVGAEARLRSGDATTAFADTRPARPGQGPARKERGAAGWGGGARG